MPRQATKSKKSAASSKRATTTKKSSSESASQQQNLLEKFMYDELKDIYNAEKQLMRALPKMERAATTEQLKEAFETHLTQTEEQIARLEQVFEIMGKKAASKKCEAMEGLIAEAQSVIEDTEDGSMTRDVALIISAQKVEHYEIASYGGLAQLAKTMGMNEVADLLEQTLQEEKETDALLTSIAENDINLQAEEEGGEGTEE
jgi:ferritin-like metal-binding protein YciE